MLKKSRLIALLNFISVTLLAIGCNVKIEDQPEHLGQPFKQEGILVVPEIPFNNNAFAAKFLIEANPMGVEYPALIAYFSENGKKYLWFTLRSIGVEWPTDRRAIEVQNRLEAYRKEKMLHFGWGTSRNEQVICTYTQKKPNNCQYLLTVPRDIDVKQVLFLLKCKYETPDNPHCQGVIQSQLILKEKAISS